MFPDLRCLLRFPAANNTKVLFQLPHVPVGDRMLFKHNRRYCNILKDGMDVALSFPEGMRCITWNTRGLVGSVFSRQRNREFKLKYLKKLFDANNILCLQEVHGKDEYLQAIQVLAPRFRFFGTFILDNENAGGSAICIHRDLLPEGAIVAHVITCQGRDHLVNIQSGRHNLVVINVHFEPELTFGNYVADCVLFTRTALLIPVVWASFWVTSTSAIQKNDDLMSGTSHSPMAARERLLCSTFFPHVLEVAQSDYDYTRRDSTALGVIRTLSRIDRIFHQSTHG